MKALMTTKAFQDKKDGPLYAEGQLWMGEEERADKIMKAGVAKEATVNDIKEELNRREIEFDDKLKKDELIELLKGE